ncbi:TPA: flagellin [Bacillus cereus]|uniref:Flagellin n=1 Tax=Bacillus cereus (strain B4264) TaxID=405532 RepID=B7HI68_BACC4|nr:flagellin [Bacillus cereus]ACK58900.1 flagellin protein [Bacillus cereus B4264]MEB2584312.1 flagellin [Bacillus cereus]MEB2611791.1 flagellin [Bacillus cereus]
MRINTNINSMRTQEYMRQNQAKMSNAMDRLSSGKRINNASDDAAGLAIATRMRARESGLGVAANNTQDGMSLIRTADSALNSVSNILLRMRDLANQSANGTNTAENKAAMQKEFGELKDQIKYISENTQFNDQHLLNAAKGSTNEIAIQTLDSDSSSKQIKITLQGASLDSLDIKDLQIGSGSTVSQTDLDVLDATMTRVKTATGATRDVDVQAAKSAFDKVKGLMTKPAEVKAIERAFEDYNAGKTDALATAIEAAYTANKTGLPAPAAAAGTVDALGAITKIDAALKTVADNRATLGATLNRLDFNVNNLKSQSASMASAASQIEDADMAKEMSEMTKFKILNEAGISMLSQANQTPQMVSKLLQ